MIFLNSHELIGMHTMMLWSNFTYNPLVCALRIMTSYIIFQVFFMMNISFFQQIRGSFVYGIHSCTGPFENIQIRLNFEKYKHFAKIEILRRLKWTKGGKFGTESKIFGQICQQTVVYVFFRSFFKRISLLSVNKVKRSK